MFKKSKEVQSIPVPTNFWDHFNKNEGRAVEWLYGKVDAFRQSMPDEGRAYGIWAIYVENLIPWSRPRVNVLFMGFKEMDEFMKLDAFKAFASELDSYNVGLSVAPHEAVTRLDAELHRIELLNDPNIRRKMFGERSHQDGYVAGVLDNLREDARIRAMRALTK